MRRFLQRHPRLAALAAQFAKFGSVGAVAYVVQLGTTNALWALGSGALAGQVPGTLCSIAVAFAGNRFWTFADRARTGFRRETLLFLATNGVGMLIQVACLGVAVYGLGLDGPLARNISGNVIGVGLGTLFRFWAYRTWVFPQTSETREPRPSGAA